MHAAQLDDAFSAKANSAISIAGLKKAASNSNDLGVACLWTMTQQVQPVTSDVEDWRFAKKAAGSFHTKHRAKISAFSRKAGPR
jgi:hypothetical protein